MHNKSLKIYIFLLSGMLFLGCSGILGQVTDRAMSTAGEKASEAVAQKLLTPLRQAMVRASFAMAFYSYGTPIILDNYPYHRGDWTEWQYKATNKKKEKPAANIAWIKKGLAQKTPAGEEWWHLEVRGQESSDITIYEGLFAPKQAQLLRLLAQFPGEAAEEIPLENENVYQTESGKGEKPVKGKEPKPDVNVSMSQATVQTPAGRFDAQKLQITGKTEQGDTFEISFYTSDKVPGGMVTYEMKGKSKGTDESGKETTTEGTVRFELKTYGKGMTLTLLPQLKK
ncbi:MAG: hypothetical protein NT056_04385 [Proteobacteria bacterium]|nr:hypothetical protein [Pseudomonadota bacterium]